MSVSDEAVEIGARELVRHETNGCCELGRICGLCDCFADVDTPPGHHRDGYARQHARAVLESAEAVVVADALDALARDIYNGSPDPAFPQRQAFYNEGVSPWLEERARALREGVKA